MPVTRRSAAGGAPAPPKAAPKAAPKAKGKRAGGNQTSKLAKRSKTGETEKEQKTIEETMEVVATSEDAKNDDVESDVKGEETNGQNDNKENKDEDTSEGIKNGEKNAFDEVRGDESEVKKAVQQEEAENSAQITSNTDSVIEDPKREAAMPSSIMEKGIIYFFFRGRVNIEEPQGVDDIARSYIVLRPLPIGAKLGEGPLVDAGNARLLALPKKILPKSASDRFLVFVEKHGRTVKDLKDDFVKGRHYTTKTVGTSHTPAAIPIAEGIYAITSTGRESHLAYHITIPEPLGEVQKDMGISEKGSFVLSVKNPTAPAPANASLPKGADYPQSILEKFRGLRWMPLEPELLDYDNTQILIIGEGIGSIEKATEEQEEDAKDSTKDAPVEEMEKLEDEDQIRVEHLKGDDAVFADLGLSSKEYPKMQTTW